MKTTIIIGAGPSGMIAAYAAATNSPTCQVILIEKNATLGKKLAITGGGRCNITNTCDVEDLLKKVVRNSSFLYSALYTLDSSMLLDILHTHGLATKVEDNGRVFPVSDNANDVIGTFKKMLRKDNITIQLNTTATSVTKDAMGKFVVSTTHTDGASSTITADAVILATGGLSAPVTGSTGDGYKFAQSLGHTLTPAFFPSIVPLTIKEDFITHQLQGLSLQNIGLNILIGKKKVFDDLGDMIFTHFGISGPMVLKGSAHIAKNVENKMCAVLDICPDKDAKELDNEIVSLFAKTPNKNVSNTLQDMLPAKLVPVLLKLCDINEEKKTRDVTKQERSKLITQLKNWHFTISGTVGYKSAVTTAGGVVTKEINPSTMESKLVDGLFFTGEVIDIDAYTGGYNLQICFSTGYLAGLSAI